MTTRLDYATLDLMDALDLAVLIELEAFERYKMFANQLGHHYPGDATSIFSSMAENEAKHGQELAKRREAMFGDLPPRISRDDLYDVEAPDQGATNARMSPLGALEVALSSEQKAFDFYNHALTHITDAKIKTLFIELRDEETDHIRMVREAIAALPEGSDIDREEDEDEYPAL